jgi:hypothetical protein
MSAISDVTQISPTDLQQLERGDVLALRCREFVPAAEALAMSEQLVQHPSLSAYRNTAELMRVGESHFETHNPDGATDPDALEEYLSRADLLMKEIRDACSPYESPLDRLWEALGAVGGVERASIGDVPMFAGVVRVFPEGSELLPHNDVFSRDAPGLATANEITAQFAANIYLEVPGSGGQLQLWDERPDAGRLAEIRADDSEYGASRSQLPPPDVEVDVRPGDLVVMDATKLHAVSRQGRGRRVGMSSFLGRRPGRPFICWS